MAAFKSTLSSSVPLTDRPYDGNLIASLFEIVEKAETLSTSKAPEFDPEDDIELEIRTRTAGILTIDEVLDRVNRRAS
jgi:hypothetical protein